MTKIWKAILNPRAWVAQVLLVATIGALVYLNTQGYLAPLRAWLDQDAMAITLGDYRFSIYTITSTLFIFVLLCWIVGIIVQIIENRIVSRINSVSKDIQVLITRFVQIIGYALAALVSFNILGVDLTALAWLGGAVGIGIGFGLQKIASNFISGIILLLEKSAEIGDLVELEGGIVGFVRHTGARYTVIETFQNYEVMVPNEDFIVQRVTNWTYNNNKRGRVEIPIGVSYDSDIELAQKLIIEAAAEHPRSMSDPTPVCYLREFDDSSVNFLLFFWVADVVEGRYAPQSEVMFAIWQKFSANNIKIPYPQHDIHIKSGNIR